MKYLFYLFIILVVFSCRSNEELGRDATLTNPFTEKYYLQFDNLEERLAQLMCGRFSCYSVRKKGLWTVNNGQDSLIAYGVIVGDPAKQGYWVYREVVMSHFPEEPLIQTFFKIKRNSPDSLTITSYKPKSKDNAYKGLQWKNEKYFEEEDLQALSCTYGVKKESPTHFEAYSARCEIERGGEVTWVDTWFRFIPEKYRVETKTYDFPSPQGEDEDFNHTILYYRRLPKVE